MQSRRLRSFFLALAASTIPFAGGDRVLAGDAVGDRVVPNEVFSADSAQELDAKAGAAGAPRQRPEDPAETGAAAGKSPALPPAGATRRFEAAAPGVFQARTAFLTCIASVNGVRFVPEVDGVPRTDLSLGLTVERASAGATVLFERGDSPVAPEARGDAAVVFRHGKVEERYDVRGHGVEQSFAIASDAGLRAGADLVLAGAIRSSLVASPDAGHDGAILFSSSGTGILRYGKATAIDAAGQRIAAPVALDGAGGLTIAVPGAWLATATFPIAIDPLIGTFFQVTTRIGQERFADIAYSATDDRFLVIWEEEFSPTDRDIYGQLYAGDGTTIGGPITIDNLVFDSRFPAVAWSSQANVFLVAWTENPGATTFGATNGVYGAYVDHNGFKIGPTFPIHATTSFHNFVDLGGRADGGTFLVTWTIEIVAFDLDVACRQIDTAGNRSAFFLVAGSSINEFEAAVNPIGSGVNPWCIAWSDDTFGADIDTIAAAASPQAGTLDPAFGTPFDVLFSTAPERIPAVAGAAGQWIVSADTEFAGADYDVRARAVGPAGPTAGSVNLDPSTTVSDLDVSVSFYTNAQGTPEYLFAFTRADAASATNIFALRADAALTVAIEGPVAVSSFGIDGLARAIARSGIGRAEHWVAFQRAFGGGADNDIRVQRFGVLPPAAPVADFSGTPAAGSAPLTVTFADLSTGNPTAWAWNFGDGTGSTVRNPPAKLYANPGTYAVSLTVTAAGGQDTEVKAGYITVGTPNPVAPVANFAANVTSGVSPLAVTFTDASTGQVTGWLWDFGDGTGSNVRNPPVKTYNAPGSYTVTLTATGPGGQDAEVKVGYISVTAVPGSLPVADFSAAPRSGTAPLMVQFTNVSSNATSFLWNFGDGATSTDTNPSHAYAPGAYAVSLLAANASGSDTETKVDFIVVVAGTGSTPGGSTPGGSNPGGSTPGASQPGSSPTSSFTLPRSGGGGGGCALATSGDDAAPATLLPLALLAAALGLARLLLRKRARRESARPA